MGMKSAGGGEIVQVQGGHIVRSTGRKDRHSKVYTAKGPRDRRVRLSAHTAIQFYDVQDRLGYDRPSKAVDWLIKKAKSAIDKLDELPPWHPSGTSAIDADLNAAGSSDIAAIEQQQQQQQQRQQSDSSGYGINIPRHMENNHPSDDNPFMPQSLDSDTIADTMKSFFPTTTANLSLNFPNYPHHMISNSANKSQDLCLSLHSFQDPSRDSGHHTNPTEHTLFAGSDTVGYEAHPGEWTDHQPSELNRFHRMMGWNGGGGGDGDNRGGGFVFNQPALTHHHHQQQLLGSSSQVNSEFSQRGTLQSSFSNSVRAWDDLPISSTGHHETHQPIHHHSSSISGNRFVSEGFSGFCIPARIHGEEDHGVVHDKRPSASPNPHR